MSFIQLTPEVYALKIEAKQDFFYPTLLIDGNKAILVDTGYPEQAQILKQAVEEIIAFKDLEIVLFTHHDIDHIGCTKEILHEVPNVKTMALSLEKPYLEGEKTPAKLGLIEKNYDNLPAEMKEFYPILKAAFANRKITIDLELTDGMELPYCGGITVIHTPGHVPGHTSFYLKKSKILIAGDALRVNGDQLALSAPEYTFDMEQAIQSAKKLAQYDIEHIIAYHGGVYHGGLNALEMDFV